MTGDHAAALRELGVARAAAAIVGGEVSPVELAAAYLERIEEHAEPLNAFRAVTAESALEEARAAERSLRAGGAAGPLHGVPVAVKDNIDVAGVPLTAGTSVLGHVPEEDAPVVRRLREAGAVLLGKLHMSEWAIGGTSQNVHFGAARNPWDPSRVTGGSSGGSGAAVAADLVPAALGTDTGGSVRIPAALCGVTGLRPTVGHVSNRGTIPVAWSFDTVGPLSRRAEDVGCMLEAIGGYDPGDPLSEAGPRRSGDPGAGAEGLRIGLLDHGFRDRLPEPIRERLDAVAATFERLGARVEPVVLDGGEEAHKWVSEMVLAEAAWHHAERLEREPEVYAPDVRTRLTRGMAVTGRRYARGRQLQREWRRMLASACDGQDLLLAPACAEEAPPIEGTDPLEATARLSRFTALFGFAGVPGLVMPCGFGSAGLPVAVQLVGRRWDEPMLLRAGRAYQQSTDWHLRRPSLEQSAPA